MDRKRKWSISLIILMIGTSMCTQSLGRIRLLATLWTAAHQAPLSMGFFSGKNTGADCHFLLQGIFPTLGDQIYISCVSCMGRQIFFFFNQCITWKALIRDLPSPLSLVLTKNSEPFLLSRVTGRDWPSCSMTVTPGTSLKTKYII